MLGYGKVGFATPVFGYVSSPDSWKNLLLDEQTKVEVTEFKDLHPKDQAHVLAEQVRRGIQRAQSLDPNSGMLEAAIADGSVAPQALNLLPGDPDAPVYTAKACQENLLHAIHARHLPQREPLKQQYLDIVEMVFPIFADFVKEQGGKILEQKAGEMKMDLSQKLSNKWDTLRKSQRFLEALLYTAPRYNERKSGKTGLPKSASIKCNESLTKMKPRGILSGGDLGVVIHMADAGLLEAVLFSIPFFEERSVKHAVPAILAQRMAARLTKLTQGGREWFRLNTDFGAFDSSVRWEIRSRVENLLATWASEALGGPLGKAAARDRNAKKHKARGYGVTITSENWCRMSGDRGTSVLNYVTNWVVTLCSLVDLLIEHCGYTTADALNEVRKVLRDHQDKLLDLMAEGDDGSQYLSAVLVRKIGEEHFVDKWVQAYSHFGFTLEPQTERGRETSRAALVPILGRNEFVSRIFEAYKVRSYPPASVRTCGHPSDMKFVVRVRMFNKPRKMLDSLSLSFHVMPEMIKREGGMKQNALIALQEKAISAMGSSVDCPTLFSLMKRVYDYATAERGAHLADIRGLGYKGVELSDTYLDAENGKDFYEEMCRKREKLSKYKAGDQAADHGFVREMLGSASTTRKVTEKALRDRIREVIECSDGVFLEAWRRLRREV